MLNTEPVQKYPDTQGVYDFVITKYGAEKIGLDLILRNYSSLVRLKTGSNGKYSVEDIILVTKLTVIKLKEAVTTSQAINNTEHKLQPTPNVDFTDALNNARVIAKAVPELQSVLQEALQM